MKLKLILLATFINIYTVALADNLGFSVHQLGYTHPVILIIGGIQGDEPGGFNAASLLTTHYVFPDNNIWVVPNLNFPSIINNSRGLYGDMNRKFDEISDKDPEYGSVKKIQEIISDPAVALVINMHDGSGFYRPKHINNTYSPKRWGQCLIIDKESVETPKSISSQFSSLEYFANNIIASANKKIPNPDYQFCLNNTHTDKGNDEMEKTLSWYAVRNGKAAFGLEASKTFDTATRAYYHLIMLEAFFEVLHIPYSRNFELNPTDIKNVIENDLYISFMGNKILFPLDNLRPNQAGYLPLPNKAEYEYLANRPIIGATNTNNTISIFNGNKIITKFKVERLDFDSSLNSLNAIVDGVKTEIFLGDIINVQDSFTVEQSKNYRVNAIGAVKGNAKPANESGFEFKRKDFQTNFSLDKGGNIYRIEVYNNKKIMGIFLVDFTKNPKQNYAQAKEKIISLNKQIKNRIYSKNTAAIIEQTNSENLGR